ncbi:MAG TPA: glycerophosphodiester phosphodiesterase [Stellaceae bacterium]|nr:glycerophosphodiester phosphodiesterase [Stellaceae bacterium]
MKARYASARERWPRIIGHRGAALSAPENTLAGFCMAAALNVAWVEFDVRLTRDGRCILLHDDTLDRTTDGSGRARDLDFDEIRRFDAGSWFGPDFAGQRVPSLEETIDLLAKLGLGAVAELKPMAGAETATGQAAAKLLKERWPDHLPPPLVSSFKPAALAAAREAAPEIKRALLVRALPRDWRRQLEALDCAMLHADQRRLDRAAVEAVLAAESPLFAYTVNIAERAQELFSWGVSAVFSDCPGRLAEGLDIHDI